MKTINIDLYSRLAKFGFERDETTIYVELVRHGSLRVNELVRITSIPRSSVYEHLRSLMASGIVSEQIKQSYKLYTALPFDTIAHTLREDIQRLQSLENDIADVDTLLSEQVTTTATDIQITYYEGMMGARQLLWNTLKTLDTVRVFSSWGRSEYVGTTYYERFVEQSGVRDITEKVVINQDKKLIEQILVQLEDTTSRTKAEDIRAVSTDAIHIKGETFIYGDTYAQVYLKQQRIVGFEIRGKSFADTQKSIFDTLWSTGKEIC